MQAQSNVDAKPHGEQLKRLNKQIMVLQGQLLDEGTSDGVRVQLKKQSDAYVSMMHCVCVD